MGGVKIFKQLFSSFSGEKVEEEFDDFDILNGVLIKKENYGKEQQEKKMVSRLLKILNLVVANKIIERKESSAYLCVLANVNKGVLQKNNKYLYQNRNKRQG